MRDAYELWVNQVAESELTRENYLQDIGYFEVWARENYHLEVREIPWKWREAKYESGVAKERYLDELNDALRDYFGDLKGRYAPLTVNHFINTVISYLHAFDIPVKTIKIKHAYVKYHNRDITKEEIREILQHSHVRNRAAYLMLYESGMRPATLTKLKWRHIKEEFLGHKMPMKIDLPAAILKCRISERWTFIGEEGFEALKRYLTTRFPLKEDDYVFEREKPLSGQLGRSALSQAFNKMVKKLGLAEPVGPQGKKPKAVRLYCLKKAFKKFHSADGDYKKFWMGRSDTSTHYVSRDLEYHRQLYAQGYENLRLQKPSIDAETIAKLTRENLALKEEVEELKLTVAGVKLLEGRIKILEQANEGYLRSTKEAQKRYDGLSAQVDRLIAALERKRLGGQAEKAS